jgi:hypothetical protein
VARVARRRAGGCAEGNKPVLIGYVGDVVQELSRDGQDDARRSGGDVGTGGFT